MLNVRERSAAAVADTTIADTVGGREAPCGEVGGRFREHADFQISIPFSHAKSLSIWLTSEPVFLFRWQTNILFNRTIGESREDLDSSDFGSIYSSRHQVINLVLCT